MRVAEKDPASVGVRNDVMEPDPRHYHQNWAGGLSFTIEGLRFYRDAAIRAGVACRWDKVRSLERLRALHRRLFAGVKFGMSGAGWWPETPN